VEPVAVGAEASERRLLQHVARHRGRQVVGQPERVGDVPPHVGAEAVGGRPGLTGQPLGLRGGSGVGELEQLLHDRLLRGEVVKQRRLADAHRVGDLARRGAVVAALGEQPGGLRQDPLARRRRGC